MTGRPYILAESYWGTVRDTVYDVAILPWGATEAHNFHLPYSTDVVESDMLAAESARLAWSDHVATIQARPRSKRCQPGCRCALESCAWPGSRSIHWIEMRL